jgi:NADPH2:quinone reductase
MPSGSDSVCAARLHHHSRPLVAETMTLPEPAADEVRVELEFGGVNPVDGYIAEGRVNPDGPLPRTLGGEGAGYADGRAVLVAGEGLGTTRDGVWAQAANVPRAAVLPLPAGVQTREAAAMGIAGLTALNVVRELAGVTAEDRVLVLGASGGVGSMIVSLAHAAGATVWGQTGSDAKTPAILEQGADKAVVSGPDDLADQVAELQPTVVFDPLGDGYVAPVTSVAAPRARIVSFGTSAGAEVTFNMQVLYRKMLSLLGYGGMQLDRDERRTGLESALRALGDGAIRVRIDEVIPLGDVGGVFTRLQARGVQGKLLLDLS